MIRNLRTSSGMCVGTVLSDKTGSDISDARGGRLLTMAESSQIQEIIKAIATKYKTCWPLGRLLHVG